MYIRYLDSPDHIWERRFIEVCGLSFDKYWYQRQILTRSLLEGYIGIIIRNLNELERLNEQPSSLNWIVTSLKDLFVGYQILGILILQTGSILPEYVKGMIMESTTWEFDRQRGWSEDLIESRKFFLEDFRQKIDNHRIGQEERAFIETIDGIYRENSCFK